MKHTFLNLLTILALGLTTTQSFATEENKSAMEHNSETVTVKKLKDHVKDTAEQFNATLTEVYNNLSAKIEDLLSKSQEKDDKKLKELKTERDHISKEIESYKNNKNHSEKTRRELVHKLEKLDHAIEDCYKTQK